VPTTAWISSTITVSTDASVARAREVSSRKSDSGVVIRMSGGLAQHPRRAPTQACPRCGSRRRHVVSVAAALGGARAMPGDRHAQVALGRPPPAP
jgi:hypothetical protein